MTFLKKIGKFLLSPLGAAVGLFNGGKKGPKLLPGPVTRDDMRDAADSQDALLRRRGAAADMLTGTSGAEASAGIGRIVAGS